MPKNEKNQWDMYSKYDDDFDRWEWGESTYVQNITDTLVGAMKEAARLVIREIRAGLMSGLSVKKNKIVVEFFTFDGYFEMSASLDDMIDYELDGVTNIETGTIDERDAVELRVIAADLERQAAKIRKSLPPQQEQ